MPKKITHFTHPKHPLVQTLIDRRFKCDGCKYPGSGLRYYCDIFDFVLHDRCATCPPALHIFAHPLHPLTQVARTDPADPRVCDLCREPVRRTSYRCVACGFDLHPLCAMLPPTVEAELHSGHALSLVPAIPQPCSACGEVCLVWRYRCIPCKVNLHPQCLFGWQVGMKKTTHRG
ncbi:protein VACUOLELESS GAMETOPHYTES-like [Elaeis guineensis]|uniref:protein VACUOLELESS GAMETOPHYTES-like n=1 Tax=Elaeis guineensis var. tenera TaxID=51953 RepID=UPI003C6D929B